MNLQQASVEYVTIFLSRVIFVPISSQKKKKSNCLIAESASEEGGKSIKSHVSVQQQQLRRWYDVQLPPHNGSIYSPEREKLFFRESACLADGNWAVGPHPSEEREKRYLSVYRTLFFVGW